MIIICHVDGMLQMPTQPNGFFFATPADATPNSPTKSPPEGSFGNIFGGMSSGEPSTSEGSGGFNIFGGDPFSSGPTSTPSTTQDAFFPFF